MYSTDTAEPTGITLVNDNVKVLITNEMMGAPANYSMFRRKLFLHNAGTPAAQWSTDGNNWVALAGGGSMVLDGFLMRGPLRIKNVTPGSNVTNFHATVWEE